MLPEGIAMKPTPIYKVGEVVCYQIPDDIAYVKIAPIQEVNHELDKVSYKLGDQWIDAKYIWYSEGMSRYKPDDLAELAELAFNQPKPMSQSNLTITRSIELNHKNGWSHIITNAWQDVGVEGITIYYAEPNRPKEQLIGMDTETARAIAKAILELTDL
jgi:hypothetical protein